MRQYTIKAVSAEPDWEEISALEIDNVYSVSAPEVSAEARLCHDGERLYVRLEAVEPNIRAEIDSPVGMPCEDSCLEFFFSPMDGDSRYFNIEFNPNCSVFLGFGSSCSELTRLLPKRELLSPKAQRTPEGWSVEYSVPFSFIQRFFPDFTVYSGKTIRANCYKCGDKTDNPHYLAWCPVMPQPHAFHQPSCFGTMIFE